MAAKITFFKVDNGDMTLVRLADTQATTILVDCKIRMAADDPNDDTPDVATELRKRLQFDADDRPFVDAFLLSHPDQDHCSGLRKHFWLGSPADYPDDHLGRWERRIIIRELWSSPLVFRRRSKSHTLCDDAKAFNTEAHRRINYWKQNRFALSGNRILIMGEDENGKTNDLTAILVKAGEKFRTINGEYSSHFSGHLLAPAPHDDDAELEERLSKNESSVIMNMELFPSVLSSSPARFLTGGDAEVLIWERMWERYKNSPDVLAYDMLLAPHHCSWHTLSYDSWSGMGEKAKVSAGARSALAQAYSGATIVSSSKKIVDDDVDPPCIRAKREYQDILKSKNGLFLCTGDLSNSAVLEFEVTASGTFVKAVVGVGSAAASTAAAAAPRAGRE